MGTAHVTAALRELNENTNLPTQRVANSFFHFPQLAHLEPTLNKVSNHSVKHRSHVRTMRFCFKTAIDGTAPSSCGSKPHVLLLY